MSAWKKQAVPLVFIEICMGAIMEHNGEKTEIQRVNARVSRWLGECWEPLRAKGGRIDDNQAQRVTAKAAGAIQERMRVFWGGNGSNMATIQTAPELTNAMLVVAEDTLAGMPKNNAGRSRAWAYLVKALYDLCLLSDPELSDNLGQDRGIKLAEIVLEEAA